MDQYAGGAGNPVTSEKSAGTGSMRRRTRARRRPLSTSHFMLNVLAKGTEDRLVAGYRRSHAM
jgi:hypothetical protein